MRSQDETRSLLQRIWRSITEPFAVLRQRNQEIERVNAEFMQFVHSLKDDPPQHSLYLILLICPISEIVERIAFIHLFEGITIQSDPAYHSILSEERIARIMSIRAEMPALTGPHGELTLAWLERAKSALDEIVTMQ
jgi:hypothetical protein